MSTVEKIAASMFSLIMLYLIVANAEAVNNIINALSRTVNNQVTALQGR